ncbi:MAG: hypothetical protein KAU21_09560, partial [Gammaproteobacteria bacterium]|nr:hypothetical protein [Gammaproteobacteria bacterium]
MTLAKLLLVVPFLCQYAVAAESTMMVDNFRKLILTSGIDGAIEQYRKLPNSDRQQLHDLANELLDQQMFDDALRIFQLNADFYPDDWQIRKSLAAAHYELQHYRLALVNYQQALDILEASAPGSDKREGLLKKIARIYRKLGNYYAALYIYQLEIARDPGADWAVQKIGQWMLKYGNRKVGIRWLKRATDMQGSPDRAWQKLGNYYKKRSSYRYIRHLREGLNLFPYLAASWDQLIGALLDDYRLLEAERIAAEALTLFQAESLWRTARTQQGRTLIARYAQK